jgi:hypothetical protein
VCAYVRVNVRVRVHVRVRVRVRVRTREESKGQHQTYTHRTYIYIPACVATSGYVGAEPKNGGEKTQNDSLVRHWYDKADMLARKKVRPDYYAVLRVSHIATEVRYVVEMYYRCRCKRILGFQFNTLLPRPMAYIAIFVWLVYGTK